MENDLREKVHAKIEETLQILDFQSDYTVVYKRMGKTAGKYSRTENILFFDPLYLQNHTEHYLNQTVPHEVCHLVQWLKYTEYKGHGPIWKSLMRKVGLNPDRCNSTYNIVPVRRVRKITFECNCQTHEITLYRAAQIEGGIIRMRCRKCRSVLRRKV